MFQVCSQFFSPLTQQYWFSDTVKDLCSFTFFPFIFSMFVFILSLASWYQDGFYFPDTTFLFKVGRRKKQWQLCLSLPSGEKSLSLKLSQRQLLLPHGMVLCHMTILSAKDVGEFGVLCFSVSVIEDRQGRSWEWVLRQFNGICYSGVLQTQIEWNLFHDEFSGIHLHEKVTQRVPGRPTCISLTFSMLILVQA